MTRPCLTCQHLKRDDIDRRLAAGEPASRVAKGYALSSSGVHRHRTNCLGLAPGCEIKKQAARGTAALALLPEKDALAGAYFDLRDRIDQIVTQAQQQGSLSIAINGLNSIRQTLDSLARLAGHTGARGGQDNLKAEPTAALDRIAVRLIQAFDDRPDVKAQIAQALFDEPGSDEANPVCAVQEGKLQ